MLLNSDIDWLQIGMSIVTASVPFWLTYFANKIDAQKKDRERHEEEIMHRINNLEEALMAMQTAESERMAREQERMSIEQARMEEFIKFQAGVMAMLRDRILQSRRYFCGNGFIPSQEFENVEAMYKAYKALGGNGLVDRAFQDLSDLPFELPA